MPCAEHSGAESSRTIEKRLITAGTETGRFNMMGMSMNGLLNNRKGTSLAEILVVMVILLIGIMYVVTMFPAGFHVVLAAESQTIATKLAQAEIERWKNMPGNLPDGILPLAVGYGTDLNPDSDVLNDTPPGPPFEAFTGPAGATNFVAGNVVNFRYVRNETTPIPVGSYFTSGAGAGYGSKYTLAFSPIEATPRKINPTTTVYDGLTVKSGELLRRRGDSDSDIYLRPGQYGIDYTLDSGKFNVSFSYDRNPAHVYLISYSYWVEDTNGNDRTLLSKVDQPISPDPNGGWTPVTISLPTEYSTYNVTEMEENTDTCARGFVQVTAQGWTDDPYEFALVDSITGVIAFNPHARNMTEYTARGVRAITARIDYRICDPRIIREDKVVQAANEDLDNNGTNDHTAVKLALRFILNAGQPDRLGDGDPTDNPDEPTFEGLVRQELGLRVTNISQLRVSQSMLIIDLATGLRVSMKDVTIDFKSGIVHLPVNADLIDWQSNPMPDTVGVPLQGRHLRFFYRADGDWSVQCHKAYTYYLRKSGTSKVDYYHFKFKVPSAPNGPYQLLFARCDSGKSVTVDYSYIDSKNVTHKMVGHTFKISEDWTDDGDVSGSKCSYVTLDVPNGCTMDPMMRIVVTGASFKARVIWRDGKHWRFVDIDTTLTRNSSR